ncbi:putative Ig domain-containing protein, partial [Pyxidicoccus sp. 3LFB2]
MEARGGAGATSFSLEGTPPAGLAFSAGAFSGVPTAAGTAALTVTARDVPWHAGLALLQPGGRPRAGRGGRRAG